MLLVVISLWGVWFIMFLFLFQSDQAEGSEDDTKEIARLKAEVSWQSSHLLGSVKGNPVICICDIFRWRYVIQVNLDMTDSMGPGKLVRHMQNPSYTYDTYFICMGLGPSILSVMDENTSYSGLSYPSSPVYKQEKIYQDNYDWWPSRSMVDDQIDLHQVWFTVCRCSIYR